MEESSVLTVRKEARPDLIKQWGDEHMDLVVQHQNLLARFRRKNNEQDCIAFVEIFDQLDFLRPERHIDEARSSQDQQSADTKQQLGFNYLEIMTILGIVSDRHRKAE